MAIQTQKNMDLCVGEGTQLVLGKAKKNRWYDRRAQPHDLKPCYYGCRCHAETRAACVYA